MAKPSESVAPRDHPARCRFRQRDSLMAVPAHFRVDAARALPAARVGVATVAADLVAADAIGGWPGLVAACASHDVASRGRAMEIAR